MKQFAPSGYCLRCLGCCRFSENPTIWASAGCRLVESGGGYRCEYLNKKDNRCAIYSKRPLDCRLYPFLLVKRNGSLSLGLHKSCLFVEDKRPNIREYVDYLKKALSRPEAISELRKNPEICADYRENVEIVSRLNGAYKKIFIPKLNRLTLKDKPIVDKYLKKIQTNLSAYHFAPLFIWRDLFKIYWVVIENNLCLFYATGEYKILSQPLKIAEGHRRLPAGKAGRQFSCQDNTGMFMASPPLGPFNAGVVKKCFKLMDFYNQNSEVGRIENVREEEARSYARLGLRAKLKDREYACLRDDLVNLRGDGFRHKRSSYNHFIKTHNAQILEYSPAYQKACLGLYRLWMNMRGGERKDIIYQQMLEDSRLSFQTALKYYGKLGLAGYIVKAGGEIKACSFGYPLNRETFCILFEVCDLNFKGIAQFIFREFARKLSGYKYVNIMGASDLENLKKHKLSYRPAKEISVYNIYYPRLSVYKNG